MRLSIEARLLVVSGHLSPTLIVVGARRLRFTLFRQLAANAAASLNHWRGYRPIYNIKKLD